MFKKQICRNNTHKTLGISLLEVMLSIIVITAIIIASLRYYTVTRENTRIAQAVEMINNVATASFKWVEGKSQRGFDSIAITELVNSGLLPLTYKSQQATINPWRGRLDVDPKSPNSVTITLGNVPAKSCTNLRQKIINIGGNAGDCATTTGNFTATWSQQE